MVYDNCQAFISHTLEQCQRTEALACTGTYRDTSNSKLPSELGWPTLAKRREYYKLCQLFKLVHTMSPTNMTYICMVQRADHNHNYDLRNEGDIRVPYGRTVGYRRSFYPSTIRLWNELSMLIRNSPSLSNFKYQLKGIMFHKPNPLYSFGLGRAPVHLARLRMGLSGRNQHRHSYHYIPRPCDSCGHKFEGNINFFLHCPTYQRVRNTLILSVSPIVLDISPDILNIRNNRHAQALFNLFSTGDPRLSTEANKEVFFPHVFEYIIATKRFR